jgi:DNA-binding Xre family transcriptional regulator
MVEKSRSAHAAAVEATKNRINTHMKATGTKGKELARQLGMTPAEISSFRTGKRRCGPHLLNRLREGLDRISVPDVPISPVTLEYDLLLTIKSLVEAGGIQSCTLAELVFIAALPQQEGYPPRRLEVDMKHISTFSFNLLPLMKVIVGSRSISCTVNDLLEFLSAQQSAQEAG